MENIRAQIREFLSRATNGAAIEDNTNIFELGLAHSLFTVQMILFIEGKFGIELELDDIKPEDISTIAKISELISTHLVAENRELEHAAS
ncbi:Hypothetical protein PSE_3333 [Pseudovibrio sp. FO-BEG1]|jgi:acyl carrier protein|uniref:Phosphopantetheine attachment site n=1 Tax=Pseudovibrio denitrificans TaxID=258256 RepID=A0A1I7DUR6_9HYPH|nr:MULTISPECIES: phosphopantetheine-binding protein [Pseudovibrio]AEV37841.1 Hypothetical protein PSE_3333 [Pseudovibrio sp. FO-BEG1]SFU15412.1 Phosphopantetheine attachment site [Pseudovibrio denitrificans]